MEAPVFWVVYLVSALTKKGTARWYVGLARVGRACQREARRAAEERLKKHASASDSGAKWLACIRWDSARVSLLDWSSDLDDALELELVHYGLEAARRGFHTTRGGPYPRLAQAGSAYFLTLVVRFVLMAYVDGGHH